MAGKPQSNRRQFLTGQAALDAASHLGAQDAAAVGSQDSSASPTPVGGTDDAETYLLEIERTAMACSFQVLLNAGQHAAGTEAALEAMDLLEPLEEQLSWFRESSELSTINRFAATEPVVIERRLFALLQRACELSEQTAGAFDIAAAPLWKLWGFHRREGKLPSDEAIRHALGHCGAANLVLDPSTHSIVFRHHETEINLGAIGKGYALDRCAEHLTGAGVESFIIHGGMSSMSARGKRAGSDHAGWSVALRHPLKPDQRLAELCLRDRALGTSGTGSQFFHVGGRRYGHILDPRTGYPADSVLSATALAPTAAEADALATAFFVMGVEETVDFCGLHPEYAALIAVSGQRSGSFDLVAVQLSSDDWIRLDGV